LYPIPYIEEIPAINANILISTSRYAAVPPFTRKLHLEGEKAKIKTQKTIQREDVPTYAPYKSINEDDNAQDAQPTTTLRHHAI
jgi:hypothetical protein